MAFERLRRRVSGGTRGVHFATVLLMPLAAALAILILQQRHLVSPSPIWLIPVILGVGQVFTITTGAWWRGHRSRARLHLWIASQTILVTATIYATGWGPALAIGLVLVGQETLVAAGSSSERAIVSWTLACLAVGQGLIALGWAPSLIPVPQVHGLAILMAIGIIFSYRSLRTAMIDREAAATLTEGRERRFRALVQSSSDLVFVVDVAGTVSYASPSSAQVLGYEPEVLVGPDSGVLLHEDDIEELHTTLGRIEGHPEESVEFAIRVRHQNGSWRRLEGIATNLLGDPAVAGLVINARDVTERRERLERQSAIGDLGREALRATTLEESIRSSVEVIERMLHARYCRVVNVLAGADDRAVEPVAVGVPGVDPAQIDEVPKLRVPVGDPEQPIAFIEVFKDSPAASDDEQFLDSVSGMLLSATVRFGAEDAIRHQAMHDPLTGLPNRALFNDRLAHALRRRSHIAGYVAVMIVDLDAFKVVNDSLGHRAGDELLAAVATRFTSSLRGFDTVARLGGDEFAILFDALEAPAQAGRVAQRVLDSLMEPLVLPDREVAIGASVGIALTDQADAGTDRLLADADAAMYRAKREGKGCYRVFEAAMHTASVERMTLEQELRSAIRDGALTVHYQPIVDTATGRPTSFEALARWEHPTRGFVPPDKFIPLAEESGLILDLGWAVLLEACRQAQLWAEWFPGIARRVSVNASRLQLADPRFADQVADALARADLAPSSLVVEVTESVLASESGRVITSLDSLRRSGVRVAIDDFGTGYSSFAALADLPIDILKIDKRFVDNLLKDDQGQGFVNAIMQIANTLNLETTAEGVEEPEQYASLAALGCTNIQGYLFSRPIAADQVRGYLTDNGGGVAGSANRRRRRAGVRAG
ncbi:MAG: putative bifunctional diguanylate cyclase/phosphodiesterase [Acidimicrobiales bacterium]